MGNSPFVFLVATKNQLVSEVKTDLIAKGCNVTHITSPISFINNFVFKKRAAFARSYLVFIMSSVFSNHPKPAHYLLERLYFRFLASLVKQVGLRAAFVLPFTNSQNCAKKIDSFISKLDLKKNTPATIIFAGNLGLLPLNNFLETNALYKNTVSLWRQISSLPGSQKFFPTTPKLLTPKIIEILFSLKYHGSRVALLGKMIKNDQLKNYILSNNLINKKGADKTPARLLHATVDESFVLASDKLTPSKIPPKLAVPIATQQPGSPKEVTTAMKLKALATLFLILTISPVLIFLLTVFLVTQENTLLGAGKFNQAILVTKVTTPLLTTLRGVDAFWGGVLDTDLFSGVATLEQANKVAVKKANIIVSVDTLYKGFVNDRNISNSSTYVALTTDLKGLYDELNLLEASAISGHLLYFFPNGPWKIAQLEQEKVLVANFVDLAKYLPEIVGETGQVKYMIIFEDPKFPRPSGGKVTSGWAITIDKGVVINAEQLDLTKGHSNLIGSLPVPQNYQEILGKSWGLENYNLFPFYEESAKKALYFADKQFGFQPDAVISINVEDFETTLDDLKAGKLTHKEFNTLAKYLLNREIQVYFSDPNINNSFGTFIASNNQARLDCFACNTDYLSYFEVSSGNSQNILRQGDFKVSIEEGVVKHNLKLSLVNVGETSYEVVLGFLVNENAGFSPPAALSGKASKSLDYEVVGVKGRKVLLTNLTIASGDRRVVELFWENSFNLSANNLQKYVFLWGPSAGVPLDLQISMAVPEDRLYAADPELVLTRHGVLSYNTNLLEGSSKHIYLK